MRGRLFLNDLQRLYVNGIAWVFRMIVPLHLSYVINEIPIQVRCKGQALSIKALHGERGAFGRPYIYTGPCGTVVESVNGLREIRGVQPDIREPVVSPASWVPTVLIVEIGDA